MHHPDTFPRERSGATSGFLAYRCGGSAGLGRSRPHRLPVSPCAPVWLGGRTPVACAV